MPSSEFIRAALPNVLKLIQMQDYAKGRGEAREGNEQICGNIIKLEL
jgi:hypothetical protein